MNKFYKKYSLREASLVFVICMLPSDLWMASDLYNHYQFLSFGRTAWDFIGIISYSLMYALVDILLLFLVAIVVGWLLPHKWGEKIYVPFSMMFILGATLVAELLAIDFNLFRYWPYMILFMVLWLILSVFILQRIPRLKRILIMGAERIAPLSYLYLAINLIGVGIVIIRNLPV